MLDPPTSPPPFNVCGIAAIFAYDSNALGANEGELTANHSPCHPLDKLLAAAEKLAGDDRFAFLFAGGGSEWGKIRAKAGGPPGEIGGAISRAKDDGTSSIQHRTATDYGPSTKGHHLSTSEGGKLETDQRPSTLNEQPPSQDRALRTTHHGSSMLHAELANVMCLPYQPLEQLAGSLSATDLHMVEMGDLFVGLVHPCKIYNVLAVGSPVLYVGPEPSHVSEILTALRSPVGVRVAHGEVSRCVEQIRQLAERQQISESDRTATVAAQFCQAVWLPRLVAVVEG